MNIKGAAFTVREKSINTTLYSGNYFVSPLPYTSILVNNFKSIKNVSIFMPAFTFIVPKYHALGQMGTYNNHGRIQRGTGGPDTLP